MDEGANQTAASPKPDEPRSGRSADNVLGGCIGGCALQLLVLVALGFGLEGLLGGSPSLLVAAFAAAGVPLILLATVLKNAPADDWVAHVLVPLWLVAGLVGIPFL